MATQQEPNMRGIETMAQFSIGDGRPVEDICAAVAKLFEVRQHEVALLFVDRRMLRFLFPTELRSAGAIPLTSSAVAARTVNTKRAELFNNFVSVQHSSIFETVKLGTSDTASNDPLTIQKMMSVPIMGQSGTVLGAIQISRKGFDNRSCGPDFTPSDLSLLADTAMALGRLLPSIIEAATRVQ